MNLYLSRGRVWTGTLIDAREAQDGKDFEHIDFPTDKPGLLAILNDFPNRFPGMFGERMARSEPMTIDPDLTVEDVAEIIDAETNGKVRTVSPSPVDPGSCVACHRTARVAKIAANSSATVNIMADLEDVTDSRSLVAIIQAAEERMKALTGAA